MKDLDKSVRTWFEAALGPLEIHVVNVEDSIDTEIIRVECKGRLMSHLPRFGAEFMSQLAERLDIIVMSDLIDRPDIDLDQILESPELVSINQDPLLGPQWFRYVFKVKKIQP